MTEEYENFGKIELPRNRVVIAEREGKTITVEIGGYDENNEYKIIGQHKLIA